MLKQVVLIIIIVSLLFGICGCGSGEPAAPPVAEVVVVEETAVPDPTDPPPTEPPATATPIPSTPTPEPDLVDLVMVYQSALNAGETANVTAMYAEDIQITDTLLEPLVGKEAKTAYVEFTVGNHSQLDLVDCVSEDQTVTCHGEMVCDWQTAANLDPFIYDTFVYTFQGEQIIAESHQLSKETDTAVADLFVDFTMWSRATRPGTTKRLLGETELIIPDGDNAQSLIDMITTWKETSFIDSPNQMVGVWKAHSEDYNSYMRFFDDGTGFLYLTEDALSLPFDPERGDTVQLEYWFEGSVLHTTQVAGFWKGPGVCDADLVGQYFVEGSPQGQISFLLVKDPCNSRRSGLRTDLKIWDWVE